MVDGRVVGRPRDGHRFFELKHFGLVDRTQLNWRPGGALR
jgi:hypothetical protein